MSKYILSLVLALSFVSCTYSINMTHTDGTATDVGDDTTSPTNTTTPTLTVPVSMTPSPLPVLPSLSGVVK
jgi:hypothetical protein